MQITTLLTTPRVRLLMPPARLYRTTIALLWLVSWGVVLSGLWYGREAMGLLHWVGVLFGGVVGIMVSLPRSWQPWRLAEIGWDHEHIYLLNGHKGLAFALPRTQLIVLELVRRVGHDGQWLDFSLDLQLSESALAEVVQLLDLKQEAVHQVGPSIYRFGFKRAWHSRQTLASELSDLQSV
ncbi:hypothetical protein [Aeromonas cavernicola]|uniref:Uncharacterized protein n=1 Tax=Aeromonas cavernicola TaxID=1006623 RepID=A0A2H9U8S8_9GAMM|nr:hypothetical protein [Aeromonas cavernicola]PJG60379.1 hypothetical protein CUC53_02420 [Aeromonas cavernicola]